MKEYRIKGSRLLVFPNGKFTVCGGEAPQSPRTQALNERPNFSLAIDGGQRLLLGDGLVFSGMEETEHGCALHYHCPRHQLTVTTLLSFTPERSVIVQTNRVKNTGNAPVTLSAFSSAMIDELTGTDGQPWYQNEAITVHICHSKWQGEGQWRQYTPTQLGLYPTSVHPFECAEFRVCSLGSRSTEHFYPLVMLEDRARGKSWFLETEGAHSWQLRLAAYGGYTKPSLAFEASGCDEEVGGWHYTLSPGEEYTTERAFFGVVDGGFEAAVAALTDFKRADSAVRFRDGLLPVVFNDYMNCLWSQQDPALLLPLIDRAAEVGAEVFCIDGGWCGKVNGRSGIGDWLTQPSYYDMDGLRRIAAYIQSKGMRAGIWLELESCDPDAFGASLEEDCVLKRYNARLGEVYTYNFGCERVRTYLTQRVAALYDMGFRFIKNDYNHSFGIGSTNNYGGESPAEGEIVNARQFLSFLDSLYARFPDLIIENCGGGAMRSDNSLLRRCYLQSTSDQELYWNNPSIVMGSMALMPPEKAGIWAYPYPALFPYDSEGRYLPFSPDARYLRSMADGRETVFNMVTAMCGFLYLSGRIDACDEKNLALIKDGVQLYRQVRHVISRSRAVYPLGLLALGEKKPAALGLLSENRLLLAVWNLTDAQADTAVPLAAYTGPGAKLEAAYPAGTACRLDGGTLHVQLGAASAAYLVLSLL